VHRKGAPASVHASPLANCHRTTANASHHHRGRVPRLGIRRGRRASPSEWGGRPLATMRREEAAVPAAPAARSIGRRTEEDGLPFLAACAHWTGQTIVALTGCRHLFRALVLADQEGCRRRRKGADPRACRRPFPSARG
jgi:hypothetical protein